MRIVVAIIALLWFAPAFAWPAHGSYTGATSAPVNTVAPTVSPASPIVGSAETGATGTWTGSPTFACQWEYYDTTSNISGATSCSTYTPVSGDVGHTLAMKVAGTNSYGTTNAISNVTSAVVASTDTAFSLPTGDQVHYISPTGSDSNNGLSTGAAWATPNHALNCGDVIVAVAGTHNEAFNQFGSASNCPSASGGIDGTGGINFVILLCGGSDLGSNGCNVNCSTAACSAGIVGSGGSNAVSACMNVNQPYWAVEGWSCNGNGAGHRGFAVDNCLTTSTIIHHVAFVNDTVVNAGQGFDVDNCGYPQADTNGSDYWAVVGSIAQNAAQDSICLGAIDAVGVGQLDANSGTHIYWDGDFSYAHTSSGCTASDVEAYIYDTWDERGVTYTGVMENNYAWRSTRFGVQTFWQNLSSASPTIKINQNTFFEDNVSTGTDNLDGEINIASTAASIPWNFSITNNLMRQPLATSAGGHVVTAQAIYNTVTGTFTNSGNVMRSNNSSCTATSCNSTFDAQSYGGSTLLNTSGNTYADPTFANTSDLTTNWVGVPTLTGFENVVEAMGYNAYTATLTSNTPIADLTPTSTYSSKGAQLPSTTCNTNANFPTWLKGVVYLHWTGSAIVQRHGLVTTPCGL